MATPFVIAVTVWASSGPAPRAYLVPALAVAGLVALWPGGRPDSYAVAVVPLVVVTAVWLRAGAPGQQRLMVIGGVALLAGVVLWLWDRPGRFRPPRLPERSTRRAPQYADGFRGVAVGRHEPQPAPANGSARERQPGEASWSSGKDRGVLLTRVRPDTAVLPGKGPAPGRADRIEDGSAATGEDRGDVLPESAAYPASGCRRGRTRAQEDGHPMIRISRSRGVLIGDRGKQINVYTVRIRIPALSFAQFLRRAGVRAALRRLGRSRRNAVTLQRAVRDIRRHARRRGPALRYRLPRAEVRFTRARSAAPGSVHVDRSRRIVIGDRRCQRNRFTLRADRVRTDVEALLRESSAVAEALVDAVVRGRTEELDRSIFEYFVWAYLGLSLSARPLSVRIKPPVHESVEVHEGRGVSVGDSISVDEMVVPEVDGPRATVLSRSGEDDGEDCRIPYGWDEPYEWPVRQVGRPARGGGRSSGRGDDD